MSELVLLRNSERAKYRNCRLAHHWSYDLRLSTQRTKTPLLFGTDVHEALAVYYPPGRKRGPHPAKTFATIYDRNKREYAQWDEDDQKVDARELGIAMLEGYVDLWGKDDHIEIIQPEISIQIDVMDRQGRYLCTWVGQGDAMYKDLLRSTRSRPSIGFIEHKTAKSIREELNVLSQYGEQALSYWWAGDLHAHHMGWLPPDVHVEHVMMNWLRKALPDTRPMDTSGIVRNKPLKAPLANMAHDLGLDSQLPPRPTVEALVAALEAAGVNTASLGEPSKRQPRPRYHREPLDFSVTQLDEINRRIRAEAWEIAQVRAGKLPMYKSPGRECDWCEFKEMCELHEMGADWESMMHLEFDTWDPYEAHELVLEKAL